MSELTNPTAASDFTRSPAWSALRTHQEQIKGVHMRALFAGDPKRFEKFSLQFSDILVDYSKNRVDDRAMALLMGLAEQQEVGRWRDAMFSGEKINGTENRAVLHVALR